MEITDATDIDHTASVTAVDYHLSPKMFDR
jgi:hypothetical protein